MGTVVQPPQVILAGVSYTGVPTAQWVAHVRLAIEEGIQERRQGRKSLSKA